jgi:hypothetical protein
MHWCHTKWPTGKDETVHTFRHRMPDYIRGKYIGASRQMWAVLLDTPRRQNNERVLLELRRDLRLRKLCEIPARQLRHVITSSSNG